MKDLTKGNPLKIICMFSLPIFIGCLFNLAYSIADIKILGYFIGNEALAAAGSVSGLYDFLNSFMIGLTNGFGVICAVRFGASDMEGTRKAFSNALFLAFVFSIAISSLCLFFMDPVLVLLNVSENLIFDAKIYISVMISGLVFSALYNCLAASLRAVGDAFTPLIFLILSTLLNILMDILLVGSLSLGTFGAALATVISQIICVSACFLYTFIRYKNLRFKAFEMIPREKETLSQLISSGISMALMSSMVAFGTLSLQTAINTLGDNIVIAHSATRKLSGIYMLPFGVFGTAMATYSGQNYGAGKKDRIKQGIRITFIITCIYSFICVLVSYTVCPAIIKAITSTSEPKIIDNAVLYQKFDTLFYFVPAIISIFRNSLQGMGEHRLPVVSSFMEFAGKILIAIFLTPILKYWGIILSEPIVWFVMVVPLIYGMRRKLKNK